jgi:hypothetical protein
MSTQQELEKAVSAHAAWKGKFRAFMKNELEFDAVAVGRCNGCDFGKWLEGDGKAALGAAHSEVHAAHAGFHTVAAEVVKRKHGGDVRGAEALLEGEFTKTTTALTLLISALRHGTWKAA